MPLFEMEATRPARVRVFLRAQLPFLLSVLFIAAMVALGHPDHLTSPILIAGVAVTFAASAASVLLPWEKWRPTWMLIIAVADMIAVAFLRADLTGTIPSVGMLAIFPVLWISYGFGRWAISVAIVGAAFITSFTFAYQGRVPGSVADWINVIVLPVLIVAVAFIVNIAADKLRRSGRRIAAAHDAESAALRLALDSEFLAGSILNTVHAAVIYYDADGALLVANRRAIEMSASMGLSLAAPPYFGDDVFGADRVTPIPREQQTIARALRGENIADHLEWVGPPDLQRAINIAAKRVHREDGVRIGTVVVAHDVTDLATAVDVREQFLKTVSHELRSPMTSIIGYLDLIGERLPDADRSGHAYLDIVLRNADSLMDRIGELVAATTDSVLVSSQHTDLTALVGDAIADVGDRAEARGMTIERVGEIVFSAPVDPWRMRQVVRELLTNAVKFGTPHTAITIGQVREGDVCRISVTNTGPAIGRSDRRLVFDRFYRAPHAHQNAIQGFGIGLSLVKDVIASHHGRVIIDAPYAGATRFTIEVPSVVASA
ncbi:HAMP domain-containing histidine kinase [Microbacterium sp. cx-55]|uniref:sensor histidine kinase n=1 Tax=Microbacterium sp. cx-55 TaxID=2875948 RepID=UPI001CBE9289|nr:HAMP domain-containing sensor histidine kinase [Microbacterium sp. cx-55]MBZ4486860.1 HAMP domain-containing histidine kinase [Microbacterium sp. cx-55]UGB35785.1 HAMP domain-containing histidine kinase [Microbacterium sp. cx-55]